MIKKKKIEDPIAEGLMREAKKIVSYQNNPSVVGMHRVTFDLEKYLKNLNKHGISLEDVSYAIHSVYAIAEKDEKHSVVEERWKLIAWSASACKVLYIVFVVRDWGTEKRAISARIASKKERARLFEKFPFLE